MQIDKRSIAKYPWDSTETPQAKKPKPTPHHRPKLPEPPASCRTHSPSSCRTHSPSWCRIHSPSACHTHSPSSCRIHSPSACRIHSPSACHTHSPCSCRTHATVWSGRETSGCLQIAAQSDVRFVRIVFPVHPGRQG